MALLPQFVADRYVAPGVRFVPLADDQLAVRTAALTGRDCSHRPTAAFVGDVARRPPDARGRRARDRRSAADSGLVRYEREHADLADAA